jgi:hypothetical protein
VSVVKSVKRRILGNSGTHAQRREPDCARLRRSFDKYKETAMRYLIPAVLLMISVFAAQPGYA